MGSGNSVIQYKKVKLSKVEFDFTIRLNDYNRVDSSKNVKYYNLQISRDEIFTFGICRAPFQLVMRNDLYHHKTYILIRDKYIPIKDCKFDSYEKFIEQCFIDVDHTRCMPELQYLICIKLYIEHKWNKDLKMVNFDNNEHPDITIMTSDNFAINAHRVILTKNSSYFKRLLSLYKDKNTVEIEFSFEIVNLFINAIYGTITRPNTLEHFLSLFELLHKYEADQLAKEFSVYIYRFNTDMNYKKISTWRADNIDNILGKYLDIANGIT